MTVGYINSGQFTLGPYNSISIFNSTTNEEVNWGIPTTIRWESKPVTSRLPINLMRGIKTDIIFDQGWSGSFSIQRTGSGLDVYWSAQEAQIRAGIVRPTFTIIQRIKETDLTNTQITFNACQITYDEAGTYENEQGVVQMLTFTSPARTVIKT